MNPVLKNFDKALSGSWSITNSHGGHSYNWSLGVFEPESFSSSFPYSWGWSRRYIFCFELFGVEVA